MIRLSRSMIQGLDDPSPDPKAVRNALQNAVKLEHATIPPYLTMESSSSRGPATSFRLGAFDGAL